VRIGGVDVSLDRQLQALEGAEPANDAVQAQRVNPGAGASVAEGRGADADEQVEVLDGTGLARPQRQREGLERRRVAEAERVVRVRHAPRFRVDLPARPQRRAAKSRPLKPCLQLDPHSPRIRLAPALRVSGAPWLHVVVSTQILTILRHEEWSVNFAAVLVRILEPFVRLFFTLSALAELVVESQAYPHVMLSERGSRRLAELFDMDRVPAENVLEDFNA